MKHAIVRQCSMLLQEAMIDAIQGGAMDTEIEVCTEDGCITIKVDSRDNMEMSVWHENRDASKPSPLLKDSIYYETPYWRDLYADYAD